MSVSGCQALESWWLLPRVCVSSKLAPRAKLGLKPRHLHMDCRCVNSVLATSVNTHLGGADVSFLNFHVV